MAQWGNVDNAANSVNWAVSQLNKSISTANTTELFGNVTPGVYFTGANVGQFGVDTAEMQVKSGNTAGPAHAGWTLRTEGSGGRAGRVFYETLIAMGSMTGDGEDVVFPDYRIVITTQPSGNTANSGDPASFTVVSASVPTGATLTYHWQVDGGTGVWANVANGGVYTNNTSPTLSISDNTGLDGNVFRVLITTTGGATPVYSANATLTEV
jgi:hypothetical protein